MNADYVGLQVPPEQFFVRVKERICLADGSVDYQGILNVANNVSSVPSAF